MSAPCSRMGDKALGVGVANGQALPRTGYLALGTACLWTFGQERTAGSAAATSEATRPAWCGTERAARPCATAAAAAASTASSPLARNAPTILVRTSPVP